MHDSFVNACQKKVNPLEAPACPGYANTFVGAESPKVSQTSVGGPVEVCTDAWLWIQNFKQAEIDLKLTLAALPKGNSLLATNLDRLGTGGVGPSSQRGLKWREYAWKHGEWPTPPASPAQLSADGNIAGAFVQLDANGTADDDKKKPIPGADAPQDTPRGLPKYVQNAPVPDDKLMQNVKQSATKYQILPGSPDGAIPPVEVPGDLFTYCSNQMSEIMMGFAQTSWETVKLTKGWCVWQASVHTWVGKKEEHGHPDWTHRTCTNMQNLLAFALRDQLSDKYSGLSAQQVCKNIFNTINGVHRTNTIIVKEAWAASLRGAPSSGLPAADDSEMKKMLQEAQEQANKIFGALRKQKSAYEALNNNKMDAAAFDPASVKAATPPDHPDLPDSGDLDPTALLALSVEHMRQHRSGITSLGRLSPWGRATSDDAAA